MSAHNQIFIQSTKPEIATVADISRFTDRPLSKLAEHSSVEYRGQTGRTIVEIELTHSFENEPWMEFEYYPIVVTFRDLDSDVSREDSVARYVLDGLAEIGGYKLALVFDLQKLVARYP